MAKRKRERASRSPASIVGSFLRTMLLAVAALVGFLALASGADLEDALLRVIITLIILVMVGYCLDFVLWYSQATALADALKDGTEPIANEIEGRARRVEPAMPQAEPVASRA